MVNKIDLFYQRCHLFKKYFPEYDGDIHNKYQILDYIKSLYLDIAKKYNQHNVHCVCTKLTDSLEIASFDVEQIKDILMNYQITNNSQNNNAYHIQENNTNNNNTMYIHKDIVDTIIDYAIGDVFWSEKWLKPMWEKKMKMELSKSTQIENNNNQQCDHINNPHDYHRHRQRKRKSQKSNQSISNRISSIFQSK